MAKYVRSITSISPSTNGLSRWFGTVKTFGTPQWNVILVGILLVLVVGYVVAANRSSTATFTRLGLEQRIEELRQANQQIQLGSLEYRSLARIRAAAQSAGMIAVDEVKYLTPTGGAVAVTP